MASFQVRVTTVGKEAPLKSFRLVADLNLREAKSLSEYLRAHVPCVLLAGVERDIADHVAKLLTESGCNASVEGSTLEHPMLLCPDAKAASLN